jgi:hypothetical protein
MLAQWVPMMQKFFSGFSALKMIRFDPVKSEEANTFMLHPKSPLFHQMISYHRIFHPLPIPNSNLRPNQRHPNFWTWLG